MGQRFEVNNILHKRVFLLGYGFTSFGTMSLAIQNVEIFKSDRQNGYLLVTGLLCLSLYIFYLRTLLLGWASTKVVTHCGDEVDKKIFGYTLATTYIVLAHSKPSKRIQLTCQSFSKSLHLTMY